MRKTQFVPRRESHGQARGRKSQNFKYYKILKNIMSKLQVRVRINVIGKVMEPKFYVNKGFSDM